MIEPGRKFVQGVKKYRYGFNGKENDNEVKGEGNQQDYGMRIYDPRLGKFLSVDPLTKEYTDLTPYQFSDNCPIKFIDLDGEESSDPNVKPSGITYIAVAKVRGGIIQEQASFTTGNYSIHKTNASGVSGDFYTARYTHTEGKYKGMYEDQFIIGPESVNKFIKNSKEYEILAARYSLGFYLGGSTDLSVSGLWNQGKSAWTPVNIGFGIIMGGRGVVGAVEAQSSVRPTWQETENAVMSENPGYTEQVSFKNGKVVSPNTKGSVRPEGYRPGESIEVKNYNIVTKAGQNRLVKNVVKQAMKRIANLPKGTHQNIIIEMSGNKFRTKAMGVRALNQIRNRIQTQAGSGNVTVSGHITFK